MPNTELKKFVPLMKNSQDDKHTPILNLFCDEKTRITDCDQNVYSISDLKRGNCFTRLIFKLSGLQVRAGGSWSYVGRKVTSIEIKPHCDDECEFAPPAFLP